MSKKIKKKISPEAQELLLIKKRKQSLIAGSVFAVILVGWLVFAIADDAITRDKKSTTEVNFDSIMDYIEGLSD